MPRHPDPLDAILGPMPVRGKSTGQDPLDSVFAAAAERPELPIRSPSYPALEAYDWYTRQLEQSRMAQRGAIERAIEPPTPEQVYTREFQAGIDRGLSPQQAHPAAVRAQIMARESQVAAARRRLAPAAASVAEAVVPLQEPEVMALYPLAGPAGRIAAPIARPIESGASAVGRAVAPIGRAVSRGPTVEGIAAKLAAKGKGIAEAVAEKPVAGIPIRQRIEAAAEAEGGLAERIKAFRRGPEAPSYATPENLAQFEAAKEKGFDGTIEEWISWGRPQSKTDWEFRKANAVPIGRGVGPQPVTEPSEAVRKRFAARKMFGGEEVVRERLPSIRIPPSPQSSVDVEKLAFDRAAARAAKETFENTAAREEFMGNAFREELAKLRPRQELPTTKPIEPPTEKLVPEPTAPPPKPPAEQKPPSPTVPSTEAQAVPPVTPKAKIKEFVEKKRRTGGQIGGVKIGAELQPPVARAVQRIKEAGQAAKKSADWLLSDLQGRTPAFETANRVREGQIQIAEDAIVGHEKSLLKRIGTNEKMKEDVGGLLRGDFTTSEYETAWRNLMDKVWPGGRAGAAQRMRDLKALLEKEQADKGKLSAKKTGRLADLDRKIARMEEGDKLPLRDDPEAKAATEAVLPIVKDNLENVRTLVHFGLMTEEGALNFAGRYLARFYKTPEGGEAIAAMGRKFGIKSRRFMQRAREQTPEMIASEIRDQPAASYGVAARDEVRRIFNAKFLDDLSRSDEIVSTVPREGWKQLNGKGYGPLDGKWVRGPEADELKATFDERGNWDKFVEDGLAQVHRLWSAGNTIASVSAHTGNIVSNFAMNYVLGVRLSDFGRYYGRAAADLWKKGQWYQEAVKNGMHIPSPGHGELSVLHEVVTGANDAKGFLRRMNDYILNLPPARALGKLYQAEDAWTRLTAYVYLREQGMTAKQAVSFVDKHIPNYRQMSRLAMFATRTAFPLMSFAYKQAEKLPRYATAGIIGGEGKRLVGKPGSPLSIGMPQVWQEIGAKGSVRLSEFGASIRFGTIAGGLYLANELQKSRAGVTPEQWQAMKKMDPPDIKRGLHLMKVPLKMPNGDTEYWDLTRFNPWPAAPWARQVWAHGKPDVVRAFSELVQPTSPVYSVLAAAATGVDPFTKRRLWPESLDRLAKDGNEAAIRERNTRFMEYAQRSVLPPYTPLLGRKFKTLIRSSQGQEYQGRTLEPGEAASEFLGGPRTRAVNYAEAKKFSGIAGQQQMRESAYEVARLRRGARKLGASSPEREAQIRRAIAMKAAAAKHKRETAELEVP